MGYLVEHESPSFNTQSFSTPSHYINSYQAPLTSFKNAREFSARKIIDFYNRKTQC